jgi:hypothetical protein
MFDGGLRLSAQRSDGRLVRAGRECSGEQQGAEQQHGTGRLQRSPGSQRLPAGDREARRAVDRLLGHHAGVQPNALTRQDESNGTSVVDVTDAKLPKYIAHIPGEPVKPGERGDAGGAQMVRVCAGSELPHADRSKFYLLRSLGNSPHEMWDVTDPAKPNRITTIVSGLRDTHKSWWECDTGAYLVGGAPGWRTPRMAMIYDLSDPAKPAFIRYFGLPGQQPGAKGPVPESLHGPMSTARKEIAFILPMAIHAMAYWKSSTEKSC